jgi:hypothetical protein
MQIDSMRKADRIIDRYGFDKLRSIRFNGEHFVGPRGERMTDAAIEALVKQEGSFERGIGATSLKRYLLTKWAMTHSRREVVEAARKFSEPVLYTLAGLAVGKMGEKSNGHRRASPPLM